MKSQQHFKDELMLIIKIQDQKIQNLTNRLNNLEQLSHKWQKDELLSKCTSELLAREVDCLKQYSRPSCIMISGVKLPEGKSKETAAETTEKEKELLTDSLHIGPTQRQSSVMRQRKFIDYLWQTDRNKLKKHHQHQLLYVNLKVIPREKLFSNKNELYINSNKKIKFDVSLQKHRLELLEKAQNHIPN